MRSKIGRYSGASRGAPLTFEKIWTPVARRSFDGPVDLAHGGVGVVHREGTPRSPGSGPDAADDLGHAVVGEAREIRRQLRPAEVLDGGRAERQHLHVSLVAVHDPEAQVEVGQHRDRARPLLHVARGRHNLAHAVEEGLGEDVGKDVDLHRISRVAGRSGPGWTYAPRGGRGATHSHRTRTRPAARAAAPRARVGRRPGRGRGGRSGRRPSGGPTDRPDQVAPTQPTLSTRMPPAAAPTATTTSAAGAFPSSAG